MAPTAIPFFLRRGGVLLGGVLAVAQIPAPTDAPRPLTPEQSAAAFVLPPGFKMEVVASEPLIASPTGVCWDEHGRMFVSELHGYNLEGQLEIEELNQTGKLDTQVRRVQAGEKSRQAAKRGTYGVVKLLRDTDGDGRMDRAVTWADDLPPAYGLVPARGGVIVACAPDIVYLADRDGDGVAEVREVLFTGFRTGALERGINAPQWGADGWIYFGRGWGGGKITGPHLAQPVMLPGSDFRIRADGSAIEAVTGGTKTFGFATTESGARFVVTTTSAGIAVAPLPWRYLARHPDATTPTLEAVTGDRHAYALAPPHPWRQRRADDAVYSKYYRDRYGAAESDASGWFTAACGPLAYLDAALPGLQGQYFVCEPAGSLIHRALIVAENGELKLNRAAGEEHSEFAASRDSWCHPIQLTHGPDGAIWIVDFYREIIEDYSAIPRHLQQQYGLDAGHDRGRIYRLTHREAPRGPDANLSPLDPPALAREIASPLLWRRQTAQRLLAERAAASAVPALRALLTAAETPPAALIAALHTLEALDAVRPADVAPLLEHAAPSARIHALQLGDRWLASTSTGELTDAVLRLAATETDPRVLLQCALSLGEMRDPRALAQLARFARERIGIRWMDAAILSSVSGRAEALLAALVREPGASAPLHSQLARAIIAHAAGPAPARADAKSLASFALPPEPALDAAAFHRFVAALAQPRNLARGHAVFTQSCALCHRIVGEGREFGPDLMGAIGGAEEGLLHSLLAPSAQIRPGYETTVVATKAGLALGILKDESATSLTLVLPGGIEEIFLRKDVAGVRQVPGSLMPSFATTLTPSEVADLFAWLRSNLGPARPASAAPSP